MNRARWSQGGAVSVVNLKCTQGGGAINEIASIGDAAVIKQTLVRLNERSKSRRKLQPGRVRSGDNGIVGQLTGLAPTEFRPMSGDDNIALQ